jgi:hypothetical protein
VAREGSPSERFEHFVVMLRHDTTVREVLCIVK